MEAVHLTYFETPKDDLKIHEIYRNEALLQEMESLSAGCKSLPDASRYYTTPVVFPKPGSDRPYIVSSIVLSADGKMAFMDNQVGPLIAKLNELDPTGGADDFWCLNMLRANSDGILVGARTLQNEPTYINNCMDISLFRQRQEVLGKPNQPCQVVVSLDATDIPYEHITFRVDTEERLKMLIATSVVGWENIQRDSHLKHCLVGPFTSRDQVDAAQLPAMDRDFDLVPVIVTGQGAEPDTELLLYVLRKLGMEVVCAEAPSYCGHLMQHGCLDEYFINYSMLYVGGTMSPGAAFPKSWKDHPHADLVSVGIHRQNFLFTRQKIRYGITSK